MPTVITGTDGINQVQAGAVESGDLASGAIGSGDLPAGSVIQVVSMPTNTSELITTSTSFIDVSGFNLTITPTSSLNKIYLSATAAINIQADGAFIDVSISRSINSGSFTNMADTTTVADAFSGLASFSGISGTDIHTPVAICHIDDPSATSSVEYKVIVRSRSGGQVRFNPEGFSGEFIAMEIAG